MLPQTKPNLTKPFFDLGWDYYAAKQGLPFDSERYPAFVEGYVAAQDRIVQKKGDRFHMKWLQIRYGALKRNRIFDERITPAVLKSLDVDVCPVTLVPLTHSKSEDTDWSIDRVWNKGGYLLGNLVIVSTRANKAKGSMTYDEIYEASKSAQNTNGLTPLEWKRWRFICSLNIVQKEDGEDRIKFGYFCAPFVTDMPQLMFMNPSALLQYGIAHKALESGHKNLLAKFTDGLPKVIRSELNKLVKDAARLRTIVRYNEVEVWLNERLFRNFFSLFAILTEEHKTLIMDNMANCREFKRMGGADPAAWNPDYKGYNQ